MSTQADRSPWLSLDLAAGIGLYLLTLFGELCVAALIRWPLVYLGVALVKPFLPFSPDPSHLAWTAVLGPLCWSLLGLVLPGRGSLWGRRLGARRPSVEEKDAIADAMGQLRQVDPALPDPPRFLVIDDPIPTAAVRGLTVLLGRAMVELDSLPADLDPDAGVGVASGAQRVRWAEVASDQPALVGGRVITVAAAVSTQRLPIYLAVTVRHESRRGLAWSAIHLSSGRR